MAQQHTVLLAAFVGASLLSPPASMAQTHDPYFVGIWSPKKTVCDHGVVPSTSDEGDKDLEAEFEAADADYTVSTIATLGLGWLLATWGGVFPHGGQWSFAANGDLALITDGKESILGKWSSDGEKLAMNLTHYDYQLKIKRKGSNRFFAVQEVEKDADNKLIFWKCQAGSTAPSP